MVSNTRLARLEAVVAGLLVMAAWAPAGAYAFSFNAPVNFPAGTLPVSVAVAEFNGDTDPDLIVANESSNNVSILLGGTGATFTGPTNHNVGLGPQDVAVGDFNGDSDPDLAVANGSSNDVSVLVGGAGTTFSAPTNLPVGIAPIAIVARDFNGDSDPDLAVVNEGTNDLSLLLGAAGATFSAPSSLSVGSTPQAAAVADFNGDSDPDLAVANGGSNNVSVLLGGAGPNFGAATNLPVGTFPVSLAAADFNGDSDPDLAVANDFSNDVSVLLGGAAGTFSAAANLAAGQGPVSITTAQLNGDSDPDLAVANELSQNVSVALGRAGGTFGPQSTFTAGNAPIGLAAGRFNPDSHDDLAVANQGGNNVSILTWIPDTTQPQTTITAGPSGPTNDSTPTFTFSSNEAGSTFECRVDGDAFALCSSPHTTATLPDGPHTFAVSAIDDGNNTDATPATRPFTVDTTPPEPPVLSSTAPASPANDNNPRLIGTAETGSTVNLYSAVTTGGCTPANALGNGSAAGFEAPGITVTVPNNSTTTFRATATDQVGNVSGCSASSIAYQEDSTAPPPPTLSATSPASPANDNNPLVTGSAEAGSIVTLYRAATTAGCTPANALASGPTAEFASPGIAVSVADDANTTLRATAADQAGNVSGCSSASITYQEDSIAPPAPTLNSTNPASPANDNNPKVIGSAEASSIVTLYAAATSAECTPANALASGSATDLASPGITVPVVDDSTTSVRATATDRAGNVSSCSAPISYQEDSAAPPAPMLNSTNPASPANDNNPRVVGSAESGSSVIVYRTDCTPANLLGSGSAANFASPGISVAVSDNSTTALRVTATDQAGNVSGCSGAISYEEDSAAPGAPTLSSTTPAAPANDNNPKVIGDADASSIVTLYAAAASADCTPANALASGTAADFASPGIAVPVPDDTTATLRATATDVAGNVSDCSAAISYEEDSTAPPAPALSSTNPASPANDNSPEVIGSTEDGSTIILYAAPTNSDCTPANALASGSATGLASPGITVPVPDNSTTSVRATATDQAGNVSSCSAAISYQEDSTVPLTPTLSSSVPPSPANDNNPKVVGAAAPGSTVTVYSAETTADCTPTNVLGTGGAASLASPGISVAVSDDSTVTLRATATDQAGNTSPCSSTSIAYEEDSTDPTAPTLTATLPASPANDNNPRIAGNAESGSIVTLFRAATLAECTPANALANGTAGDFASPGIAIPVADDTSTNVRAIATDQAGNPSSCSAPIIYVEDSLAAEPSLTATTPASPANDNSPKVIGSAEADSTVTIYSAATTADCTPANVIGSGSFAGLAAPGIAVDVPDNSTTTVRATIRDAAANRSACSASSIEYVEDSSAPAAPTLGSTNPASPANDNNPKVIGSVEAGSIVTLYAASTIAECTPANALGSGAAAALASPGIAVPVLDDTTTALRATATDQAGNVSTCSTSISYQEDSTAPAAPTLGSTNPASPANNNAPRVIGSAEAGSSVTIYETDCAPANALAGGTAAAFAAPGIAVPVLEDTTTALRATATDQAGNVSTCSTSISYQEDSIAPVSPTLSSTNPASPANNNNPGVVGGAEDGSTVTVYRATTSADCTPANALGSGTAAAFASPGIPVTVLNNTTTTLRATATDGVGNVSACSPGSIVYEEDSTPPSAPTPSSTAPRSPANDNSPKVIGAAESGSTVAVYAAATTTGCTPANLRATGTGADFALPGIAVAVVDNTSTRFRATATDRAGNVSACSSASVVYQENSAIPPAPSFSATVPASPANDNNPELVGSAQTGSTLTLYAAATGADCIPANVIASGTAATFASPGISISVPDNSTTTVRATATDEASNVSACSPTSILYIEDSTAPAAPTLGSTNPASPANNNTPTLVGTAEAGSTVTVYGTDCTPANALTGGTAAAFAAPGIAVPVLDDTTTDLRATATDVAGNVSACSSPISYEEDSTAPAAPTLSSTTPASPANDNNPKIVGSAEAGSTVTLHAAESTDCTPANAIASGAAGDLSSPGIAAPVVDDATTTLRATATDPAGNQSDCSAAISYEEDSTAPEPSIDTIAPASPANDNEPRLSGSVEAGSIVTLYSAPTTADCVPANLFASGTATDFASPGITVTVADDTATTFRATGTDQAGNVSGCSNGIAYEEDSIPPSAPTLTFTAPASPANENEPLVIGDAEAGSTVTLYEAATTADCIPENAVGSGTAAEFASPGIPVAVPDNSSTTLRAIAGDRAGNMSECSSVAMTYEEATPAEATPDTGGGAGSSDSPGVDGAPRDVTAPAMGVSRKAVKLDSKGVVPVLLSCPVSEKEGCRGTLSLEAAVNRAAKRQKVKLGKTSFRIAGGRAVAVEVRLSRKNQRLVRKLKRITTVAIVYARDQAGNATTIKRTVTLTSAGGRSRNRS